MHTKSHNPPPPQGSGQMFSMRISMRGSFHCLCSLLFTATATLLAITQQSITNGVYRTMWCLWDWQEEGSRGRMMRLGKNIICKTVPAHEVKTPHQHVIHTCALFLCSLKASMLWFDLSPNPQHRNWKVTQWAHPSFSKMHHCNSPHSSSASRLVGVSWTLQVTFTS